MIIVIQLLVNGQLDNIIVIFKLMQLGSLLHLPVTLSVWLLPFGTILVSYMILMLNINLKAVHPTLLAQNLVLSQMFVTLFVISISLFTSLMPSISVEMTLQSLISATPPTYIQSGTLK